MHGVYPIEMSQRAAVVVAVVVAVLAVGASSCAAAPTPQNFYGFEAPPLDGEAFGRAAGLGAPNGGLPPAAGGIPPPPPATIGFPSPPQAQRPASSDPFVAFGEGVGRTLRGVSDAVGSLFGTTRDAFEGVGRGIEHVSAGTVQVTQDAVTSAGDAIAGAGRGFVDGVGNAWASTARGFEEAGRGFVDGFSGSSRDSPSAAAGTGAVGAAGSTIGSTTLPTASARPVSSLDSGFSS